ncbi:MAG: hypothetical protein KatS3mg091_392 [Patescibacteria group bacterium]|nr:MAG: hypothetical protein KatS3mg091_392 [Patescibacteria group bacterium]
MNYKLTNKQKQLLTTLKKIKTLTNTIEKMIIDDKYCPDIMQQILAGIGLLKSMHRQLMSKHLKGCFITAAKTEDENKQEKMILEILKVVELYNRK